MAAPPMPSLKRQSATPFWSKILSLQQRQWQWQQQKRLQQKTKKNGQKSQRQVRCLSLLFRMQTENQIELYPFVKCESDSAKNNAQIWTWT